MVTESSLTAPLFVQFLERLVKGQTKPVYLIVDGHPVHKAKMVKDFVSAQNGLLALYYLKSCGAFSVPRNYPTLCHKL